MLEPISLPILRIDPFSPPEELLNIAQKNAVHRLVYPDGHLGWLVTGYELTRKILTDSRFSARSEFKRPPILRESVDPFYGHKALPGWLVDMDPPQHTRFRKALSECFSMRRIKLLKPRIEEIIHHYLHNMRSQKSPIDLVEHFALPIPSLVICEILGIPYEQREMFQSNSATLFSLHVSAEQSRQAMGFIEDFLLSLVKIKRKKSTPDLLTELIQLNAFSDEEIVGSCTLLLTAGHETTAKMLALGALTLLSHPKELKKFKSNAEIVESAVEELFRYLSIFHFGLPRTPLEDVELSGVVMKKGECVTLSISAANRDSHQFCEANQFKLERNVKNPHLAFGFGIHFCLGNHLARMEMQMGLSQLFQVFPNLELSTSFEEVKFSSDSGLYGVEELFVAW